MRNTRVQGQQCGEGRQLQGATMSSSTRKDCILRPGSRATLSVLVCLHHRQQGPGTNSKRPQFLKAESTVTANSTGNGYGIDTN